MGRRLARIAVLLVAPGLLGAAVNAVRPAGIRWVVTHDEVYPPPKPEQVQAGISREEVLAATESGEAVILDARSEEKYRNGRIPHAINFPSHLAHENQGWLFENVDVSRFVIVYCGGSECEESREVFDLLKAAGYENVRLYFGGWQDWTAHGMPEEAG